MELAETGTQGSQDERGNHEPVQNHRKMYVLVVLTQYFDRNMHFIFLIFFILLIMQELYTVEIEYGLNSISNLPVYSIDEIPPSIFSISFIQTDILHIVYK